MTRPASSRCASATNAGAAAVSAIVELHAGTIARSASSPGMRVTWRYVDVVVQLDAGGVRTFAVLLPEPVIDDVAIGVTRWRGRRHDRGTVAGLRVGNAYRRSAIERRLRGE
jgi:hypothetical protein